MNELGQERGLIGWINHRLPIITILRHELHDYPTPKNLNYLLNFGSLAGIALVILWSACSSDRESCRSMSVNLRSRHRNPSRRR